MPSFFPVVRFKTHPNPSAASECPPPPGPGEGHTRLREREMRGPNFKEGTYTVVLYMNIYVLWVSDSPTTRDAVASMLSMAQKAKLHPKMAVKASLKKKISTPRR